MQLDDCVLHLLRGIGLREILTKHIASDRKSVQLIFLFLGHNAEHSILRTCTFLKRRYLCLFQNIFPVQREELLADTYHALKARLFPFRYTVCTRRHCRQSELEQVLRSRLFSEAFQ